MGTHFENITAALHSDKLSIRPSKRPELAVAPCDILCANGKTVRAIRIRNHKFFADFNLYRVWVDGEIYLADAEELDLLWFGKTPAQLGLETEEIVN